MKCFFEEKLLPVCATFTELIDNYNGDVEELLNSKVGIKTLSELKEDTQILLLIDAVDEKKMDIDEHLESLSDVVNNIYSVPKMKAVITSSVENLR